MIKNIDFSYNLYTMYFTVYTNEIFMTDDLMARLKQQQAVITQRRIAHQQKIEEIKAAFELDAVINFRVNTKLKQEFERICKEDQSTVSRVLKIYMLQVITKGKLE